MLCGCPTEPGGIWDADQIRVVARLLADGVAVDESELSFSGETSIFTGAIRPPGPGVYSLEVLAMDPSAANFGRVTNVVSVERGARIGAN